MAPALADTPPPGSGPAPAAANRFGDPTATETGRTDDGRNVDCRRTGLDVGRNEVGRRLDVVGRPDPPDEPTDAKALPPEPKRFPPLTATPELLKPFPPEEMM